MAKQRKKQGERPNCAVGATSAGAEITGTESVRGLAITIRYRSLAIAAYCYIVLPILIFFVSWLRWYIGIPAAGILATGLFILWKRNYANNQESIKVPLWHLIFASILILIWLWTSGIGGYFVSSHDSPWRVAIFRDLITYRWPVIYPKTGNAFVYYLTFWLVPALFGKLFGWAAGNIALFLWSYIGLLLCFLLLLDFCGARTKSKLWITAILFAGFSGLNLIGAAVTSMGGQNAYPFGLSGMEGWLDKIGEYGYGYSTNFFYRGTNEALAEIFNQIIILWVAIPLILKNKRPSTFMFIGLCVFVYAPIPFIGLLPFFILFGVVWLLQNRQNLSGGTIAREIFSIPNLSALVTIFPITYLFFSCNISGTQFRPLPLKVFNRFVVAGLILFYIFEFLILCLIIYPKYKKTPVFYTAVLSLIGIPLFELGMPGKRDFCMNASLPALFILMILTILWLFENVINRKLLLRAVVMIVVLVISILSPVQDVECKIMTAHSTHTFPIVDDTIKTFGDKQIGADKNEAWMLLENFLCPNPETKAFYKYLARK